MSVATKAVVSLSITPDFFGVMGTIIVEGLAQATTKRERKTNFRAFQKLVLLSGLLSSVDGSLETISLGSDNLGNPMIVLTYTPVSQ